jgi:hypothetical protein
MSDSEELSELSDIGTSFLVSDQKQKKTKQERMKQRQKRIVNQKQRQKRIVNQKQRQKRIVNQKQRQKRISTQEQKTEKKKRNIYLKVEDVTFYKKILTKTVAKELYKFQNRNIENQNKDGNSSQTWVLENGGDFFREYVSQNGHTSYFVAKLNMFISKLLDLDKLILTDQIHFHKIGNIWCDLFEEFKNDMDEPTAYIVTSMSLFKDMKINIKNTSLIKKIIGTMFHAAQLILQTEQIQTLKNNYNFK